MKWILKLLMGTGGGWIMVGALLAASVAGGAAGYATRGVIDALALSRQEALTDRARLETQQCVAVHEKARADSAEKALTAMGLSVANVTDALNTLATKAAARGKNLDQFLKELANVAPSKACGSTAAEQLYRRSVQSPAP